MNDVQRNESIAVKILAIIGFSATILFFAWLLVVVVKGTPDTFSSLATIVGEKEAFQEELAQGRQATRKLAFESDKSVVNTREPFSLTWNTVDEDGNFVFEYTCDPENKASVLVGDATEIPTRLACGEQLPLSPLTTNLTIGIVSENARFTDVPMRLRFVDTDNNPLYDAKLNMTVINTNIGNLQETVAGEATTTESVPEENTDEETPTVVETEPEVVVAPVPVQWIYPTSNPAGYVDLRITVQSAQNNTVVIDVTNIGTKTSENWSFIVNIPERTVYNSPAELPLKPKEHAVFTIPDVDYSHGLVATVTTSNDSNLTNNSVLR